MNLNKILSRTRPNGSCLEWMGALNTDGYPRANINGNTNVKLHRWVWELSNLLSAEGFVVKHECDNKLCLNPLHLVLGFTQDNNKDRAFRGRNGKFKRKLTYEEVRMIRKRIHESTTKLSKEFDCNRSSILGIKSGKLFSHVKEN